MKTILWRAAVTLAGLSLGLSACERPPVDSVQSGYRGTGMAQVINPRIDAAKAANNQVPAPSPPAPEGGPPASAVYKNVQVLNDLSVAQLARTMVAITQWVAPPEQSCNYCHVADLASDAKYTKVVARRMIAMTRHLNTDWKSHVNGTGVVCYTCHRGHVVPQNVWFSAPRRGSTDGLPEYDAGKNAPAPEVGLAALPYDPFTQYFLGNENIRVQSPMALPVVGEDAAGEGSIKHTDATYALMMSIGQGLGVNCTYCHNSRSWADWQQSSPRRATAWYGIRMVRDINNTFMVPLTSTFPSHRLGVLGDVAKVNCATCHQGLFKPLYGASMVKDYPELAGPMAAPAPAPASSGATEGAAPAPTMTGTP
jgi:photosynthetic reaction center cytochrome c subunit